jgi:glycosyltransferase involved in cell wall biosynthesis
MKRLQGEDASTRLLDSLDRNKPTILVITDSARIHTGLGTTARELFRRIYATNKYNVVQLGWANMSEAESVPWLIIETKRREINGQQVLDPTDKYGEKTFYDLLQTGFMPNIVMGIGDPWMLKTPLEHPDRHKYSMITYVTIDGEPAHTRYKELYDKSDVVVSCTQHGQRVLRAANLPCHHAIPLGVDTKAFVPYAYDRRRELRKSVFGLTPKDVLVGIVARNQPRKLIPEAVKAFYYVHSGNYYDCGCCGKTTIAPFDYITNEVGEVDECWWCGARDRVDRAEPMPNLHLYIHSVINEDYMGWNLLNIVDRYWPRGSSPILFNDRLTPPVGLPRASMPDIYNCMDVFTLPTIGEGYGLPIQEAMSCGRPCVVSDAPGHTDYCRPGSLLVQCYRECEPRTEVERYRVIIQDYVAKLARMCRTNDIRIDLGGKARLAATKYDWDGIAQQWMKVFDEVLEESVPSYQILTDI